MSFDAIAQDVAAGEAKANGLVSGLVSKVTDRLPAAVPAKIEVISERTTKLRSFATPLLVFCVIIGAYRYGGTEARADLEAYRASAAAAVTKEKDREIDVTARIDNAVKTNQAAADKRADALQNRIADYEDALAHRPADARCTVSDDDLRSLRAVGTPARHRGRQTRPAASAD